MTEERSGPDQSTGASRRSVPLWVTVLVGAATALAAGWIVLAVDRPRRAPWGAWISDFTQSSGFAGLCAVVAASLALWGIHQQVSVHRRGLAHQRDVDQNTAWWARFEWAATRAVPSSPDEVPLPYEALMSTLTALSEAATDDTQRAAVGAVTDVASQNAAGVPGDRPRPSGEESEDAARRQEVLRRYAVSAGDSPARSRVVDALLYESTVVDALKRILPDSRILTEPDAGMMSTGAVRFPDAMVEHAGKRIVVEVKSVPNPSRHALVFLHEIRALAASLDADGAVVVTPNAFPVRDDLGVIAAAWSSPDDDAALRTAIDRAAGGDPDPPPA